MKQETIEEKLHNDAVKNLEVTNRMLKPVEPNEIKLAIQKQKEEIVEMIESKELKNKEFGFCKNCRFHMGDIGHDDCCGSYNKALGDILQAIKDM